MNPSEAQPVSDSSMTYFDPEQADSSEEQFAVSLNDAGAPAFVVETDSPSQSSGSESLKKEGRETESLSFGVDPQGWHVREAEKTFSEPSQAAVSDSSTNWRDLVSAKVSRYRSRKPRQERYPSLHLPFEMQPVRRSRVEHQDQHIEVPDAQVERLPAVESLPYESRPAVVLESTARVLEFPRLASPPERVSELADPIFDRPRIIEAPELLPPPPAMGGILIEPLAEPEPERRAGFDVPLQSASLARRTAAAAIDVTLVAGAVAGFAYIVIRMIGSVLPWRIELISLAGLLALWWAAYQYTFLVFCRRTSGLILTRLEIQKFDNSPVRKSLRRWRALASFLSLASLGLGYAWCFLDEDQLTWHDRITRTHLAVVYSPLRK